MATLIMRKNLVSPLIYQDFEFFTLDSLVAMLRQ